MSLRILCLLALMSCGCGLTSSALTSKAILAIPEGQSFDFDMDADGVPVEQGRVDHPLILQMVQETAPGSQVRVIDESGGACVGTLLSADGNTLQLMNCIRKEVVPAPGGQQQCRTSHTPFLDFSANTLSGFTVLAPPAANFHLPDSETDHRQVTVSEIVCRDGGRVAIGKRDGIR